MAFTEKKFRALPFINQAKKIADLLAECASRPDAAEREVRLREILRLQNFALENRTASPDVEATGGESTSRNAPPEFLAGIPAALDAESSEFARAVYRAYLFWRGQAGLGPERHVLRAVVPDRNAQTGDATEARGVPIDYSVWLHDIRSGFNVGAVLRTAECFGFRRAYLSGFTPGPEQAAVRSAAMGCEDWLECVRLPDDGETTIPNRPPDTSMLIALESRNTALPPNSRSRTITEYSEFEWPERATLVVGNEELGVEATILAEADAVLAIPVYGRKASLNLASAFAIVAAHARQSLERRRAD